MKVKVSEASGSVLDWMVAKCEGVSRRYEVERGGDYNGSSYWATRNYSTDWSLGGPIIEREIGNLWKNNQIDPHCPDVWTAAAYVKESSATHVYHVEGPTPLVAAMRVYVLSKLGDEVEVPSVFCKIPKIT